MRAIALGTLIVAALLPGPWFHQARAEVSAPERLAPLLDPRSDEVLQRAFVPSPTQRVGEVRVIRRGEAVVVQTLLYSKIMKRVVSEIRKKEQSNWPEGAAGHDDAVRYLDALDQAREAIWQHMPKNERTADRRQKLLIEFVLNDTAAFVFLARYEMQEKGDQVTVSARFPLAQLDLARSYIKRNMRLIIADSFGVKESEAPAMVRPLTLLTDDEPAAQPGL